MPDGTSESADVRIFEQPDSDLPPLPSDDSDLSFIQPASDHADSGLHSDGSALMEKEMKRHLSDMESSFLPDNGEGAPTGSAATTGADDTYLFGGSPGNGKAQAKKERGHKKTGSAALQRLSARVLANKEAHNGGDEGADHEQRSDGLKSPPTPADAYKTPAPNPLGAEESAIDDSELENDPSSPAAAAAKRNQAKTATEEPPNPEHSGADIEEDRSTTPKAASPDVSRPASSYSTASTVKGDANQSSLTLGSESAADSLGIRKRPSYLQNRMSSQRSSASSFTNASDLSLEAPTEMTMGADYALQTGGAAPSSGSRPSFHISRLPSLGSIASFHSGSFEATPMSELGGFNHSGPTSTPRDTNLSPLPEENAGSNLATPKASHTVPTAPTDTVLAKHIQNINVPDTIAKAYREKHSRSPDKNMRQAEATPFASRSKSNLTLKEQNSKIDKLSKENFDLKLKIHFLDEALQSRSDEGVKEMISKNVQLQTDLANERKENAGLRRKVREMERKIKVHEDGLAPPALGVSEDGRSFPESRQAEMEEEIMFLRERLESSESQVEKFREDNLEKEVEKRRMAEYIRSVSDKRDSGASSSAEETVKIWKDMHDAEMERREQAEEEARHLSEEVARLQSETAITQQHHHVRNVYNISKRNNMSITSRSQTGSEAPSEMNGGISDSTTLVAHLQHENEELRRDLSAQTSMLTSRNKEREQLRAEVEDLKMAQRRGDVRSVAGDSIFERSISRAGHHQRSISRTSGGTRATQISESEREEYESRQATLRDEISQLKMLNQDLERELNAHLDILSQTEEANGVLNQEKELAVEDLQALQAERDDALLALQDKEAECEELRDEALQTIDKLEAELEQKEQELNRLLTDLENRNEDFSALQQEMKNVSESIVQLEDDRVASQRKIQSLETELDDANSELESMDGKVREANSKIERLEIQAESHQSEISFLREEQEGDKIKIGELETALSAAEINLQEVREKLRDVEQRASEERRQRDALDSQRDGDVQKAFNELNMQNSKSKDEVRKLRKGLSSKEVEANTWKQRLDELEYALRDALRIHDSPRSDVLKRVAGLQRELDLTAQQLGNTKNSLAEKDRLIHNRDALLESSGMDNQKLTELLEKERRARAQDKKHYEMVQKTHQNSARSVQVTETRVLELQNARQQDRRKLEALEQQYTEQLKERNNFLLALWNRLSTLCGTDWAQRHSIIDGHLPSIEVVGRNLGGFSKHLLLALETVEGIVGNFKGRIHIVEKELWGKYQMLEHDLDTKNNQVDHLEKQLKAFLITNGTKRPSTSRSSSRADIAEYERLKQANKVLKAELKLTREAQPLPRPVSQADSLKTHRSPSLAGSHKDSTRASMAATLLRHHSTSAVEALATNLDQAQPYQPISQPLQPSEQRWIHRLKELERRLKAEREARLLDRSGARKRLEEGRAENEELRMLLERERERRASLEDGGHADDVMGRLAA